MDQPQTSKTMCAFLVLKVCMVKNSYRIGLSTQLHFTIIIITVVFKIFLQQLLNYERHKQGCPEGCSNHEKTRRCMINMCISWSQRKKHSKCNSTKRRQHVYTLWSDIWNVSYIELRILKSSKLWSWGICQSLSERVRALNFTFLVWYKFKEQNNILGPF